MTTITMNTTPAFPTQNEKQIGPDTYHYEGMTLRDYFAAKAMQGDVASASQETALNLPRLAKWAYQVADEMLKAREVPPQEPAP